MLLYCRQWLRLCDGQLRCFQAVREKEREEHVAACEAVDVQHAAILRSKEKELASAAQKLQQEQRERENAMHEGQKSAADVRQQLVAEMKRTLEDAEQAHGAEVKRLQTEHQAQTTAASSSHQEELAGLQKLHADERLRLQSRHEAVGLLE